MTAEPAGLGRSTRRMALGTLASRATGFVRTATIAAVLGVLGVGDAYNVANTTPNIVYDLLLGGVLSSVVVPLLVRAAKEDGDDGTAFAQRCITVTVVVLGGAALILMVFAPALVSLYAGGLHPREEQLAVVFARFFLPQVLFYGVGAILGAILNTRNRFAPPMWAPVLNNVVVILAGGLFLLLPGPRPGSGALLTGPQLWVISLGTTLGIVAQTVALVPSLRASGFRFRFRTDLRGAGLGAAARGAQWVLVYVVANQLAYLVVVRLATDRSHVVAGRGYTSYVNAYALWQLPHAIVAVSVITAVLPRMSRAAADGRLADLRGTLDHGIRLATCILVPAAAGFIVLGPSLAALVFAHGQVTVAQARFIGELLALFALGLVPFSVYQLQLRAFYALRDFRTPTVVNFGVNLTLVAVDLALFSVLPPGQRVLGLAVGHAASFWAGLVLCSRVLGRRLGGLDAYLSVRCAVRCTVACLLPAALALALGRAAVGVLGGGAAGSLAAVAAGGAALGAGYLLLARRLRVRELEEVIGPVLARLRRA